MRYAPSTAQPKGSMEGLTRPRTALLGAVRPVGAWRGVKGTEAASRRIATPHVRVQYVHGVEIWRARV